MQDYRRIAIFPAQGQVHKILAATALPCQPTKYRRRSPFVSFQQLLKRLSGRFDSWNSGRVRFPELRSTVDVLFTFKQGLVDQIRERLRIIR